MQVLESEGSALPDGKFGNLPADRQCGTHWITGKPDHHSVQEQGSKIRARICNELEFIGVKLDADANTSHAPVISATGSVVTVRIMRTNEELMIARHTQQVLFSNGGGRE